jgi:hypothetical protein
MIRFTLLFRKLVAVCHGNAVPANLHQVRHLSASIAFYKGLSIEAICKRAMWSSEDTFVKAYLIPTGKSVPPCVALGFRVA